MSEKKLCAATTKAGKPCPNVALPGSDYCFVKQHQALEKKPVERTDGLCGHINEHSQAFLSAEDYDKRIITKLVCALPKGHKGPHGAEHYVRKYGKRGQGIIQEGMIWCDWSDIAGTPPDQIEVDETSLEKMVLLRKLRLEQLFTPDELDF